MKSASKMGSSTGLREACTTRSAAVGIPSERNLLPAFGMVFSRTGCGVNRRAVSDSLGPTSSALVPEPKDRGAIPSTPAVRAPLFLRTRLHATTRNAGSQTRLYRSSKRRPESAAAHRCSFVCMTSTRDSASPDRATKRRCSPATSSPRTDAASTLDPFAMYTAFPCSDHYGSSAPLRRHRPATGLPLREGRDQRSGSHVHSRTLQRGRCPAMPLQPRHGCAAVLRRGLPADGINRPRSSPAGNSQPGARCDPARIHQD